MKNILTIYQKDVFPEMLEDSSIKYSERVTGKAIVLDTEGNIGLVGNRINDFFQLPGGGIDTGEDITKGILRECMEEMGCNVTLGSEVGIIEDYRPRDKTHRVNFCYIATVVGERGEVSHTENELSIGMYTKWVDTQTALTIFRKQKIDLKEGRVNFYNTGFNILRDLNFLEEAILNNLLQG